MKHFTTEFDITVLTPLQQLWCSDRAQHHHFDTVFLVKINDEGAWLDVLYDDGLLLKFFVAPTGTSELLDVS